MSEVRRCAFCQQEVKEVGGTTFITGTEPEFPYVHKAPSENGVPNCRFRGLQEFQTYTESDKLVREIERD